MTQPKGNLGDFAHASKLYTPNAFALAPKTKFLYHVVFRINPAAISGTEFSQRHTNTLNVLVKAVDLPSFKMSVETLQQYNRKKQVQSKLEYNPVNVVFHDDNAGVTTEMWRLYYMHYFADSASSKNSTGSFKRNTYGSVEQNKFKYGLDTSASVPFFESIEVFQMGKQQFQSYRLINPIITSWNHEKLDQSDTSAMSSNSMTVMYEAVTYDKGSVSPDTVPGFGNQYYDKAPSPLSIAGGGTASLFGTGGVLSGIGGTLSDLSSGNFLGAAIKGANVLRNAKQLSSDGLRQEAFGIGKSVISSTTGAQVGGLANTIIPKSGGTGQSLRTATTTAPSAPASSLTSREMSTLTNTPGAVNSLTKSATAIGVVALGTSPAAVMDQLSAGNNLKLNGIAQKLVRTLK